MKKCPRKRIKEQVKTPQAPQQLEQLNNKMVKDFADCIERIQPLTPTCLSLKFPPGSRLPSVSSELNAMVWPGSIYPEQTHINWIMSVCKVLFKNKSGAEAADKSIKNKCLFQQFKIKSLVERKAAKGSGKKTVTLKSCLKKPEGGSGSNANRIVMRVTFSGDGNSAPVQAQVQDNGSNSFKTQMLDLLRRCNNFVNSVKASPGYLQLLYLKTFLHVLNWLDLSKLPNANRHLVSNS